MWLLLTSLLQDQTVKEMLDDSYVLTRRRTGTREVETTPVLARQDSAWSSYEEYGRGSMYWGRRGMATTHRASTSANEYRRQHALPASSN